jgi:hypothetical protein
MTLIDLLNSQALQGLEALIAILLALAPVVAWTIRKVRGHEASSGLRREAAPPRSERAPPQAGQEAPQGPAGCLGLVVGYLLLMPVSTSGMVVLIMFCELAFGIDPVERALDGFLETLPSLEDPALFPFRLLAQFLLMAVLGLTLVIFYRGRLLRGVRFYIVTMAGALCVLSLPIGLYLQAPLSVVAAFDAACLLTAGTIWGAVWLVRYAWQRG